MNESQKSKGPMVAIIIVAVIVVVLAILTPIILRNMETKNRQEDVKTAKEIADTITKSALNKQGDVVVGTPVEATPDTVPNMTSQPFAKGNAVGKDEPFIYYYVKQGNSCAIYVGDDRTFNLNNETQAQQYVNK
ncbi:MAG: hypothetical protein K5644_08475 [Lachnospiraceae bacterium]|nr:hypothetical protein [Lachnospiraceae bacterium]